MTGSNVTVVQLVDANGNFLGTAGNVLYVAGGTGSTSVTINDPVTKTNQVTVNQAHNADDQVSPASSFAMQTVGVTLIQSAVGATDRQTETSRHNVPANGIATGTQQLRSSINTTLVGQVNLGSNSAFLAATKFTNRGAPAWIQIGSILTIEPGTANQEVWRVETVNYATGAITFAGLGVGRVSTITHLTGVAVTTASYNEAVDATSPDGTIAAGMPAAMSFLWNQALNAGVGGAEIQRSAAGELDNASGSGTTLSAIYGYTGSGYDRVRLIQGKSRITSTSTVAESAGSTNFTFAALTGLSAGQQVMFERGTANAEQLTVAQTWNGANPVITTQPSAFAHGNTAIVEWSGFGANGPGTNPILPDGIDLEIDAHWDPVSLAFYQGLSATADGLPPQNVEVEMMGVYNGATIDRLTGSATRGLDANVKASSVANGASVTTLISAATTNATLVKNATGRLYKVVGGNTVATIRYLKLFNKATAPVPGTDTPVMNIPLQPNQNFDINVADLGISFPLGIGFAITGGQALLDATVIAAGDVVLNTVYA